MRHGRWWDGRAVGALAVLCLGAACGGGNGPSGGPPPDPAFVPNFLALDVQVDAPPAPPPYAYRPRMCCEGSTLYAAWEGYDYLIDEYSCRFSRSADGGATWLAADVRLDTDAANDGLDQPREPQICCAGLSVYVVWYEPQLDQVRFNRSLDGGTTWLASDVRIDTQTLPRVYRDLRMCCEGTTIHVLWGADATDDVVLYQRSTDAGATWLPADIVLDSALGNTNIEYPNICCEGLAVRVVWHDTRNGARDVFFRRSTDGGATWPALEVRLDTDAPGATPSDTPQICCDGPDVYVAWHAPPDIRFNRSADGGATWLASDVRLDTDGEGLGSAQGVDLCCDGLTVHVAWQASTSILLQRSTDGGLTWLATELRLDTDLPGAASFNVLLRCEGRNVYAAWIDGRDGTNDLRFSYSTDSGATWSPIDLRLPTTPAGTAAVHADFDLCTEGTDVHAIWSDDRFSDNAIFSTRSSNP